MARVLRDATLHAAPVAVPVPGAWDPIAQSAYEQGRADGYAQGRAAGYEEGYSLGRHDLVSIADRVVHATSKCLEEIQRLHGDLVTRVLELAELYVSTVVRHTPDAAALGVLHRIEEALLALEPGRLELAVEPALVEELDALFAGHASGSIVTVVGADDLEPGEYRIRSEWAEVDGTWARYVDAARESVSMYLAEREA